MTSGFSSLWKTLERQKMSVDSMRRPLMMAVLNGLYVARMPVTKIQAEEGAKSTSDERVKSPLSSKLCDTVVMSWRIQKISPMLAVHQKDGFYIISHCQKIIFLFFCFAWLLSCETKGLSVLFYSQTKGFVKKKNSFFYWHQTQSSNCAEFQETFLAKFLLSLNLKSHLAIGLIHFVFWGLWNPVFVPGCCQANGGNPLSGLWNVWHGAAYRLWAGCYVKNVTRESVSEKNRKKGYSALPDMTSLINTFRLGNECSYV